MTNLLWPVGFALGAVVLVAWFVLTHVFSRPIAHFVASTFLGRGSSMALSEAVAKKIVYGVAVVFLFTYAYVWRSVVVDPAGKEASVREQELGDVHLTGSLVRLSLGGFRGVTTCYLWNLAMDKQMRNQLNELEVIVGRLTDLQPHFNTPWLFQSWNLAYNVSNKTDAPADKYFWVSRGVQLLADGERQNKDNPDLRYELGNTYQHKICQSDETNFQRSLFQLSLIPPDERDPARFRDKNDPHGINLEEFAKFCTDHPQLIRRLREGIHKDSLYEQRRLFTCATPQDVVLFLEDNLRVPSLYTEDPDHPGKFILDAPLARFPVLPPTRHYPEDSHLHVFLADDDMKESDVITEDSARGNLDSWDGFLVAGAWYGYSQDPLPPPGKMAGDTEPGPGPPAREPPARTDHYLPPLPGASAELRGRAPGGGRLVRRRRLDARLVRRGAQGLEGGDRRSPRLGGERLERGGQDVGGARPPQPPAARHGPGEAGRKGAAAPRAGGEIPIRQEAVVHRRAPGGRGRPKAAGRMGGRNATGATSSTAA